jgi:hypothetical protein
MLAPLLYAKHYRDEISRRATSVKRCYIQSETLPAVAIAVGVVLNVAITLIGSPLPRTVYNGRPSGLVAIASVLAGIVAGTIAGVRLIATAIVVGALGKV